MAKYLITGGCGFIGSHLCHSLLNDGHEIVVIDNLDTGQRAALPDGVTFFESSITNAGVIRSLFQDIDGCFHLAAIASVERSKTEWLAAHQTNISGFINILMAAKARKIPIVYASSAAVYGDNEGILDETMRCKPLSPYAVDKLACEGHAEVGTLLYEIPTVGFRFFNVFGPGQDPRSGYSGVISIFVDKMIRGESPVIYGDGLQTRDFIFVDDVVHYLRLGMVHAMRETIGEIFNVCRGVETSLLDLLDELSSILNLSVNAIFEPARTGDVRHSKGDPSKAEAYFLIKPETSLKQGLIKLCESLKS